MRTGSFSAITSFLNDRGGRAGLSFRPHQDMRPAHKEKESGLEAAAGRQRLHPERRSHDHEGISGSARPSRPRTSRTCPGRTRPGGRRAHARRADVSRSTGKARNSPAATTGEVALVIVASPCRIERHGLKGLLGMGGSRSPSQSVGKARSWKVQPFGTPTGRTLPACSAY